MPELCVVMDGVLLKENKNLLLFDTSCVCCLMSVLLDRCSAHFSVFCSKSEIPLLDMDWKIGRSRDARVVWSDLTNLEGKVKK